MTPAKHLRLLGLGLCVWAVFWIAGLPDYYQQYSPLAQGVGSTLLSVAISLFALFTLLRRRPEVRLTRAIWISFYFTVPFAILDAWYCGVHLGHGADYLRTYWYLTVFYFTPWLTFIPTVLILRRHEGTPSRRSRGQE